MAISKVQEMLISSLKLRGAEKDMIIMLMLQHSEEAMIDLGYWIAKKGNSTTSEILLKVVEIHKALPKELQ